MIVRGWRSRCAERDLVGVVASGSPVGAATSGSGAGRATGLGTAGRDWPSARRIVGPRHGSLMRLAHRSPTGWRRPGRCRAARLTSLAIGVSAGR